MTRYLFALTLIAWTAGSAVANTTADGYFDALVWDVGTVPGGTTYHRYFQVTNNSGKPVRIASVRGSCGCVYGSIVKNDLAPGETTTVIANFESRQFNGLITKTIYVLFDQPNIEEVRLRVQANVIQGLAISPAVQNFGKIKKGTAPERSITVSYFNNAIDKATSESGYVKVQVEPAPENGSSYRVTAKISPDLPVGSWHSTIWLTSGNQPPINIPMTVEVVP